MGKKKVETLGAGEILLTSMDRDGTQKGFDVELTKRISEQVNIPVIASGGIGTLDHFSEGVKKGSASALLAASVFHFGKFSITQVKKHLISNGINVRMDYLQKKVMTEKILLKLSKIIKNRKQTPRTGSYTSKLFKKGKVKIANKVGEEAVETISAFLSEGKKEILEESADLIFHLFVLLEYSNLSIKDVCKILDERIKDD